jgi:hypothetical protein
MNEQRVRMLSRTRAPNRLMNPEQHSQQSTTPLLWRYGTHNSSDEEEGRRELHMYRTYKPLGWVAAVLGMNRLAGDGKLHAS